MAAIKSILTKEVTEITAHKCDGCGKIAEGKSIPKEWHHFDMGSHGEYQDDAFWLFFDVCSAECFKKVIEREEFSGTEKISDFSREFALDLIKYIQ